MTRERNPLRTLKHWTISIALGFLIVTGAAAALTFLTDRYGRFLGLEPLVDDPHCAAPTLGAVLPKLQNHVDTTDANSKRDAHAEDARNTQ